MSRRHNIPRAFSHRLSDEHLRKVLTASPQAFAPARYATVHPDRDAFALVVQCGKVCEAACAAAYEDAKAGRLEWAASHYERAETRAHMAQFIATGGRHG